MQFAGTKYEPTKEKRQKQLTLSLIHDNGVKYHTVKAHRLAQQLDKDPKIRVLYDEKIWKPGEKTSQAENIRREKGMISKADLTIRLIHAPSHTGENRHAGAVREILETIHQRKPVIQLFEPGARNSPYRTNRERKYGKKIDYHLKKGESPTKAAHKTMKKLEDWGII